MSTVIMGDRLEGDDGLLPEQALRSLNGAFRLVLQTDGNLVIYGSMTALWSTKTNGYVIWQALMQSDGNFVIYDAQKHPLWFSATEGNPGSSVILQNDGNLVVYSWSGRALWWSGTARLL